MSNYRILMKLFLILKLKSKNHFYALLVVLLLIGKYILIQI